MGKMYLKEWVMKKQPLLHVFVYIWSKFLIKIFLLKISKDVSTLLPKMMLRKEWYFGCRALWSVNFKQIEQMQVEFDLETDPYITVGQVKSQVGLFQIILQELFLYDLNAQGKHVFDKKQCMEYNWPTLQCVYYNVIRNG